MPRPSLFSAVVLIGLVVLWRWFVWETRASLDLYHIELVTPLAIIAGFALRGSWRWLLPVAAVMLSDLILPQQPAAALITWSSWTVVGLFAVAIGQRWQMRGRGFALNKAGFSLILLWLGVTLSTSRLFSPQGEVINAWQLISWLTLLSAWLLLLRQFGKMLFALVMTGTGATVLFFVLSNFGVWLEGWLYPRSFAGLIQAYLMGLPFLERQLQANLLLVPIAYVLWQQLSHLLARWLGLFANRPGWRTL